MKREISHRQKCRKKRFMIINCGVYINVLYRLASGRKQEVIYCQDALALRRKDALKAHNVIFMTHYQLKRYIFFSQFEKFINELFKKYN